MSFQKRRKATLLRILCCSRPTTFPREFLHSNAESGPEERTYEAEPFCRSRDYQGDQGTGGWAADGRDLPEARAEHGDVSQAEGKYGGMEVLHSCRLRQLEDENGKLKRVLADSVLDNVILKNLLGKA